MDIELTVFSDQQEGLLQEVGTLVVMYDFSLLRQSVSRNGGGTKLWALIRGPGERLMELEEQLSSHPHISGFEANHQVADATASPSKSAGSGRANASASPPPANKSGTEEPAEEIIETELPALAREHPDIFPRLLSLITKLPSEQRAASMQVVGRRVGIWVYKRDYALGGKMDLQGVLHNIALPALSQLLATELRGNAFYVHNNPLCLRQSNGDFFQGFLQGIVQQSGVAGQVDVTESVCRCSGADECVFEVESV